MAKKYRNHNFARKVFDTYWFSIEEIPPITSGEKPYYSIFCPDSVAILAQTLDHEFILVRQFRPPQGQFTLELPSGYIHEGESPLNAARRELIEETGYSCEEVIYVGEFKICPSRIDNTIYAFCGIKARSAKNRQNKDIEVILVPTESFEKYILNGKYNESTGIAIYFKSKEKKIFLTS